MKHQEQLVADYLTSNGAASSSQIRTFLGVSQPTVSRILNALEDDLVVIGAGKLTQYAIAQPIGDHPAIQPIWLVGALGVAQRIATLSFLEKSQIHIEADGINEIYTPTPNHPLPWYLSGLRAQGFLGRILAKRLSGNGIQSNPELWSTSEVLVAALHIHDAPGAILLGSLAKNPNENAVDMLDPGLALDAYAADVAKMLPTGSSAGGEQPKFPVGGSDGEMYLAKFSPPLGTPFGDRWNDLLCAEALSSEILTQYGYNAAPNTIVKTKNRTYLLSKRFDRNPAQGRKHVVSIGEVHSAFVKGPYAGWSSTCDALVKQKRLSATDAQSAHCMAQFGHLIGNTDMHSGNASLFANGETMSQLIEGNFSLAPIYDMLPMRWKPDPMIGIQDYATFDVDFSFANESIRSAAADFWQSIADGDQFTDGFRHLATTMVQQFPAKRNNERPEKGG